MANTRYALNITLALGAYILPLHDGEFIVSSEEFNSRYTSLIRQIVFVELLLLPIFFIGFRNFTSESDAVWFQRSGSLLVFVCIVVQFQFLSLHSLVYETPIDFGEGNIRTKFEEFRIRMNGKSEWRSEPSFAIIHELYVLVLGALGTIIWGYGDLIYNWINKSLVVRVI